jgi:hypothetical protein
MLKTGVVKKIEIVLIDYLNSTVSKTELYSLPTNETELKKKTHLGLSSCKVSHILVHSGFNKYSTFDDDCNNQGHTIPDKLSSSSSSRLAVVL